MEKKILTAALKASGHYVDMAAFRLYVTPAFEKKASYYGTPECDIMNAILDAFPNMVVEIVKSNRKNNAITYDMMKKYITIMPDAAANLAEFDRVKKMSHAYRSAYQFVADWFEKKFPHYGEMLVKDEKTGEIKWDVLAQYRHFFRQQNIHCLHNSLLLILGTMETKVISGTHLLNMPPDELEYLLSRSWFAILGGMGFSGNNPRYNASHGLYRNTLKTIDEDLVETQRFSKVYEKLSDVWADGKLIVLTHTPFENWGEGRHNPNWIYVYGHTHRNEFFIDETKTVYADNQIGYLSENVQLKYFATSYIYDLFQKYPDGVYEITRDDYIDFNYGIHCRPGFSREGGTIIMLKKQGIYCFLYRNDTNHRLYLLNGGAWKRLEITDINYYYDNLDAYACGVRMLFREYSEALKRVSQIIKNIGGNGRIHGSIVDIDYYNHVRLDVRTGQLIPYHAWSMVDKWEYSSVEALLQDNNPILLENIHKYLPDEQKQVLMQRDVLEPVNDVARFVPETDMYRASRIMKTIQFLLEVNVVRIWSEEVIEWYKSHQHEQASMGMLSDFQPKKIQEC